MKINKVTLKNMLIVAGLSIVIGCKNTPVSNSAHPNTPANLTKSSPEQTLPLPNKTKPSSPVPNHSLNISHDYCPPCGRG